MEMGLANWKLISFDSALEGNRSNRDVCAFARLGREGPTGPFPLFSHSCPSSHPRLHSRCRFFDSICLSLYPFCKHLFASSLLTPLTLFDTPDYRLYLPLTYSTLHSIDQSCQTLNLWPPWPSLRLSSLLRLLLLTPTPTPTWLCTG